MIHVVQSDAQVFPGAITGGPSDTVDRANTPRRPALSMSCSRSATDVAITSADRDRCDLIAPPEVEDHVITHDSDAPTGGAICVPRAEANSDAFVSPGLDGPITTTPGPHG